MQVKLVVRKHVEYAESRATEFRLMRIYDRVEGVPITIAGCVPFCYRTSRMLLSRTESKLAMSCDRWIE